MSRDVSVLCDGVCASLIGTFCYATVTLMNKNLCVTGIVYFLLHAIEKLSRSSIEMESVSNVNGKLSLYKTSLRGAVQDYVITFTSEECNIQCVIDHTYELFKKLITYYQESNTDISCRLVAKVNFFHVNQVTGEISERSYYFPSCKSEVVVGDIDYFYKTHMLKIAKRLDYFHVNGSNFQIQNIESIHILISKT